ncbi:MAG: hypothetical protein MJ246_00110 [Clostridia bacterium]|nr:hypothetical protein [Clostridia bacterium]
MKKRYSFIIILFVLILTIAILEFFMGNEEAKEELPVKEMVQYYQEEYNSKVSVNLLGINYKKKNAKLINKEIENIFKVEIDEIENQGKDYQGSFSIQSDYTLNNAFLSIKIYKQDSNIENSSGEIYSVIYDIKNDRKLDLTGACEELKLEYKDVMKVIEDKVNERDDIVDYSYPYVYINENGNLEVILKSVIQVSRYEF